MFFSLLKWLEIQTGSSDVFTFFYVAFYLPVTLFALPIGTWINDKTLQKVMTYANLLQVVMLLVFLCFSPYLAYQWIYPLLVIISVLGLFFVPANQSLLPHIVEVEARPKANSLLQLGYTGVKVSGQIFTAFMIKLSFAPLALLAVSAILLLLSILFIRKIKPVIKNEQIVKQNQWKMMKDGISYIITNAVLKTLFLFLALAMFFVSSVELILISFLNDILNAGVENLSFIGTASLCGIAVGAAIAPYVYHRMERKGLIVSPLFALSISIGTLFFVTNWLLILPVFFLQGIALGCFNITFVTYLQNVISSENYTRTFSLYNMIMSSMALPGIIVTGLFLEVIGVLYTVLVQGGILFCIGILGIFIIPKLGRHEDNNKKRTNAV